jgi:predicted TIM-barrel fold metal-dependent hydrolase
LGIGQEQIAQVAALPSEGFYDEATAILGDRLPSLEQSVSLIRGAGVVRAVVHGVLITDVGTSNDRTAEIAAAAPDLLVPFARIDPAGGRQAVAEVRRCAKTGMRGITLTPFWHDVALDDEIVTPVLQAAADTGLVVWVHTSMNWKRTAPLELEHPRRIDVVAGRFPDLPLVCGHGGWPWLQDMVAVAWRHPNVFIDVSAFRPRNIFRAGSGWDPLVYYGARTISDSLLFGSTWTLLGRSLAAVCDEAWSVPWPDAVKERWLSTNGLRLLGAAP